SEWRGRAGWRARRARAAQRPAVRWAAPGATAAKAARAATSPRSTRPRGARAFAPRPDLPLRWWDWGCWGLSWRRACGGVDRVADADLFRKRTKLAAPGARRTIGPCSAW